MAEERKEITGNERIQDVILQHTTYARLCIRDVMEIVD